MRYVCKDICKINGVIIGSIGDTISIVDAIPDVGETWEDVNGYCDIINEMTGEIFNTTWIDVDEIAAKLEKLSM